MKTKIRSPRSKPGEKRKIIKEITFNASEWNALHAMCPPGIAMCAWMRSTLLRENKSYETSTSFELRGLRIQICNMARTLMVLARSITSNSGSITPTERLAIISGIAHLNDFLERISDDLKVL